VAEDGVSSARKDSCHPLSVSGEQTVPNRIYTPMNSMELTAGDATVDRASRQTAIKELPPCNHPMLPLSRRRNQSIVPIPSTNDAFSSSELENRSLVAGHALRVAGRNARVARTSSQLCAAGTKKAPTCRYRLWL